MKELHDRAVEATARFCERKGCEVLGRRWESPSGLEADLVLRDEGAVCFVEVRESDAAQGPFPEGAMDRAAWESIAAGWLAENGDEADVAVRFDRCDLLVLGEGRAFLRYRTDALSEA